MEERFALEVLKELKKESQRRFVLLIICLILLFVSNMAGLVAWNLPAEEKTETTSESYELQGEDNANVVWNNDGEVKINEQNPSSENENSNN